MTRYFRHGDGGLALFHDGVEDDIDAVDAGLARDDMHAKPFGFAPHTGYQRMAASRVLALLDVGEPPPPPYDTDGHDSLLALEFSSARRRLITNCGASLTGDEEWTFAMRRADAHSTVIISQGGGDDAWRARFTTPSSRRYEDENGQWVESECRATTPSGVIVRRRRLFLSARGDDLRGEDVLEAEEDFTPGPFGVHIRFHLHPAVRASLARDGQSVLLILSNGEGWRFRTNWTTAALEKSVYMGDGRQARPCEQIVLSGSFGDESLELEEPGETPPLSCKWALKRMGAGTSAG